MSYRWWPLCPWRMTKAVSRVVPVLVAVARADEPQAGVAGIDAVDHHHEAPAAGVEPAGPGDEHPATPGPAHRPQLDRTGHAGIAAAGIQAVSAQRGRGAPG